MYVVGTAGHVDHGKSTLVKTLTGIDPDRWEEEQRREMTIDLGFAWLTLPDGRSVSVIDVPGHERFIKNMLAGVGGIDAALLIIAADESVMPQTAEHLAILDLLDIHHAVVVLTKADLVEAEWIGLVQDEVRARLSATTIADAPIVAVSSRTGFGLDVLRQTLAEVLSHIPSRADGQGTPRMSIDRSFTIGGFGAVVTGTLLDGPLRVGDEVEIQPRGLRARVRGLQTHQQRSEVTLPGARVAVNLAGISHHDLARGDLLAFPGRVTPTDLVDARLRLTADADLVEQNDRLDLFIGACEVPCRVTLLNTDGLRPGETGWVQLRLERPIAVVRGDRYIVRRASPSQTLGGGRIVDIHPARHRRFRPEVIATLEALARGTPADLLRRALADLQPHSLVQLAGASGLPHEFVLAGLRELLDSGDAAQLDTSWVILAAGWKTLRESLVRMLTGYQQRYPLRPGIQREELRSRLKLGADALAAVLSAASAQGLLIQHEATVRTQEYVPTPNAEQQRQIRLLIEANRKAPYAPPTADLEPELIAFLIEQGQLVRVAPDITFLPEAYQAMLEWVRAQITDPGSVTVAAFRDRFATSRKYALALLEHLDERKITRRAGDTRVRY